MLIIDRLLRSPGEMIRKLRNIICLLHNQLRKNILQKRRFSRTRRPVDTSHLAAVITDG